MGFFSKKIDLNLELLAYPEVQIPSEGLAGFRLFIAKGGEVAESGRKHLQVNINGGGEIAIDNIKTGFLISGVGVASDFFVLRDGEVVASGENIAEGSFVIQI